VQLSNGQLQEHQWGKCPHPYACPWHLPQ